MGVSFTETMSGSMVDRWGRSRYATFSIRAESGSLRNFTRRGTARITGIVDCPPWAEEAPLDGEIRISPLFRRAISYDFEFGDEHDRLRFVGQKDLRLLAPVESMTNLFGRIERGGDALATGELRFDTNGLLNFLGSWWTTTSFPRVRMHRSTDTDAAEQALSDSERLLFEAILRAVLASGDRVPAPDDRTIQAALEQLLVLPPPLRTAYRAALRAFSLYVRRAHRRPFLALSTDEQARALVRFVEEDRGRTPNVLSPTNILTLLAIPMKSAHFARRDYLDAIGHPRPSRLPVEPKPRIFEKVIEPEDLPRKTEVRAEVVVVGTGAGGAAVACALAQQGVAVALLEAGRYFRRHDFTGSFSGRLERFYRDAAFTAAVGTTISIPQGKTVGGTTTINSGTCFPTPGPVLEHWRSSLGFPEDFAPERFGRYSRRVLEMLEVTPAARSAVGPIGDVIARGAEKLGLPHGPLPRNAPSCPGRGECIFGCSEGAKRSTDVSYIPAALAAGAELYTGLPMTRLLRKGNKVVAVHASGPDEHGAPKDLTIYAERVVLACGSLQTPVQLLENGFSLPRIGRNLSVHPAIGLTARCEEELFGWSSIPQGYSIEALEEEGIRFEGYYLPPEVLSIQLPFVGDQLAEWMDDFPRLGQFGFMVRDENVGRVMRGFDGRPFISYRVTEKTQAALKKGSALLAELFLEAGAREVLVPLGTNPIIRTRAEARAVETQPTTYADFRLLGAHPLGSCAMAATPRNGVVDFDHRVFGTENLYVVDGSVVPTSLGVNPQVTIMSMALRAADVIARKL